MNASVLRAVAASSSVYGKTDAVVDVGQVISGKYKLLRLLGDGGMGAVYEAEHLGLGTHVAIKVLHSDLARRAGLNERFMQEARVSAQIRSPHVVHVTDVDRTPSGVAYLVMELLHGEPLSNVVRREKRLEVATACEYTAQILEALEAAHAIGVIHRDLKPDNVFITFEGGRPVVKLIDFGIAKLKRAEASPGGTKNLTVAGMLMGTPEYMAPEQAYAADKVDVRADIYAVGVMLYEMLSGRTPAQGEDPRVVVYKVERGEVIPLVHAAPGTPPELAGLVHRAMAPRPELRFESATAMRIALEGLGLGKRPRTAKIAAAPAPAAYVAPSPQAGSALAEVGTGTVMGAPAAAALAQAAYAPPAGGTMHAGGLDAAHAAPAPYGGGMSALPPSYEGHAPKRRSGTGMIVALAVLALMLGAGAVVAFVLGTQTETTTAPEPWPTAPATTSATTPATTGAPTVATAPIVTTATPLTPPPAVPPQQQGPTPAQPKPSATPATPSAAPSSSTPPPPFVFPSALPSGFPSAIPIPSGFPLPSGFPTSIPWPPAPAPTPAQ